jgi:phosphoglucosamine mutase
MVLIGKDTRISGYTLESALESGLNSAGADVMLLGPIPTPAVAYLTRAQRAALGVVISASHNPYPDNGIKFFSAQGAKLPDEWELEVESMLAEPPQWVDSATLGRARRLEDAAGRYIEFCKSTFVSHLSLRGMKIVVDAANGAAYQIAPNVFHELGADVIAVGCAPDGLNINDGVGATHPAALGAVPCANMGPITASRWTATPIACKWWTARGACTTAMSCCMRWPTTGWSATPSCTAPSSATRPWAAWSAP